MIRRMSATILLGGTYCVLYMGMPEVRAGVVTACYYHAHSANDVFSMAYPPPRGVSSSSPYMSSSAASSFSPTFGAGAHGVHHQLNILDYLSDDGGQPAVPGTFGTPPPPQMTPVEPVVPDAGYRAHHPSRSAAAVARKDMIAFRTRLEEEILDDGYKWRKYGKKSVKNSPNPRNYYWYSTERCNVKKRVERDRNDPSYVLTWYEGVHNHASPSMVYYAAQDAASGRFFVAGMHHLD